jgi:hypothetical protein
MFQLPGVFSESELKIIRERVKGGLARAKSKGQEIGTPAARHAKELAAIRKLRWCFSKAGCELVSLRSRLAIRRIESVIDWAFPADELTQLANKYGSDKGNRAFGRHYYTRIYHQLCAHLRHRQIALLEIGLQHPSDTRHAASPSLRMWREYFTYGRLIGFDINDFSSVSLSNCRILQGDMSSRKDLSQLFAHGPFDIVIDDASHASAHQQIALACLFPHVTPGGFYFIEDLHWQPSTLERANVPQTRTLLRRKCFESPVITGAEAQFLAANTDSIQLFDTRDAYNLDKSDALGLLTKACVAPVHTAG